MAILKGQQYGRPLLLSSWESTASFQLLNKPKRDESENYSEWWLQRLLYRVPDSLPIQEIDPSLGRLVPVGMELRTPDGGFVDNVFVTQQGNIVIVECKLWKNPEARRAVVTQVIDYARSMANWRYQDFDNAVGKCINEEKKPIGKTLFQIVSEAYDNDPEVDEASFIDAVQRNLRLGRLLLLIAGDGIREGAEGLVDYLQTHGGLRFDLAMVEIAIYEADGHGLFVQPRLLARTLNIERAVFRIEGGDLQIAKAETSAETIGARRTSLTYDSFFEQLQTSNPHLTVALKKFLDKAGQQNISLVPATRSASIKWDSPAGKTFTLAGINLDGKLVTYPVGWPASNIGRIDLAHDYLRKLASLLGCVVRETPKEAQWWISPLKTGSELPDAMTALSSGDAWLELIESYTQNLSKALSEEE